MKSLNDDRSLWSQEKNSDSTGIAGPNCCWFFGCCWFFDMGSVEEQQLAG